MKSLVTFTLIALHGFSVCANELSSSLQVKKQGPIQCNLLMALAPFRTLTQDGPLAMSSQATVERKTQPLDQKPLVLAIAREVPIFDMAELQRRLDPQRSAVELSKSARATMQRISELGSMRIATAASNLSALDALAKKMPNFAAALEVIQDALQLSIDSGLPVRLPPILLLGDPGIGKTFFATLLAEALGTGSFFISMNGVTGGFVLAGNSQQWEGSKMGRVSESLIFGKDANPIIVLDEVDKVARTVNHDPMAPLYTLLEEKTARKFRDEFLDMEIDASQINWIATANEYDMLPAPIQSRFLRIEVPKPTPEELKIIIGEILGYALRTKLPGVKFSNEISDAVFDKIKTYSPRQIQNVMALAVGRARRMGRSHLEPQDINMNLIESGPRSIGFR